MRRTVSCLLVMCVAAAAAPADDPKDKSNAEKAVGQWKLVASSNGLPDGVTFVVCFTKDGVMTLRVEQAGGGAMTLKGKYKVEKDKIDYSLDDGMGGTKQEVLTIKKLTDDELVTVDPDGVKEEFKRVKEEKKGDKKPD